jgi:SAM-dependent methyltransferase
MVVTSAGRKGLRTSIAVDVSPAMVAAIRAKAERTGTSNVVAVRAGFVSYAHDGEPVEAVYTRNALHHLPDAWKAFALRRMADLLVEGGTLRLRDLVFSFALADAEAGIRGWIDATASDDPARGWTRAELQTHVREEHTTFTWLLEPMLARAGFRSLRPRTHPSGRTPTTPASGREDHPPRGGAVHVLARHPAPVPGHPGRDHRRER